MLRFKAYSIYVSLFSLVEKAKFEEAAYSTRTAYIVVFNTLDTLALTIASGDPKTGEFTVEGIKGVRIGAGKLLIYGIGVVLM